MDARLLFHTGNHLKIDLLDGFSIQHSIQQDIQLQDRLIIEFFTDGDQFVSDHISLRNDHCQDLMIIYFGQLNKFQFILMILWCGDHGRVIGIVCQYFDYLLQHLFQPVCPLEHQFLEICNFLILFLHQVIHIQPVSFIRRNPSCGSMGLNDITHLLQIRHLIADSSRGKLQIRILRYGS